MTSTSVTVAAPRIHITGLPVDSVTRDQLFSYVKNATLHARGESSAKPRTAVAYLNVHVANCAADDEQVRKYLCDVANLVYCDGKGIAWGAKLSGQPAPNRLTAADWLPELLAELRDAGLRVFAVGGAEGVIESAARRIASQIGGLGPFASHHGYLNANLTEVLIRRIEEFKPDVLLVGMGTPAQEHWVLQNRNHISSPVVWTIGATFDYYAGEQKRGPALFQRFGHEWLGRLWSDPARMWKRYLIGNPRFLLRVLLDRLGLRRSR